MGVRPDTRVGTAQVADLSNPLRGPRPRRAHLLTTTLVRDSLRLPQPIWSLWRSRVVNATKNSTRLEQSCVLARALAQNLAVSTQNKNKPSSGTHTHLGRNHVSPVVQALLQSPPQAVHFSDFGHFAPLQGSRTGTPRRTTDGRKQRLSRSGGFTAAAGLRYQTKYALNHQ